MNSAVPLWGVVGGHGILAARTRKRCGWIVRDCRTSWHEGLGLGTRPVPYLDRLPSGEESGNEASTHQPGAKKRSHRLKLAAYRSSAQESNKRSTVVLTYLTSTAILGRGVMGSTWLVIRGNSESKPPQGVTLRRQSAILVSLQW